MAYFIQALCLVGGFAAGWFLKDIIIKIVTGTESFVAALEAKIAALKAAL